MRHPSKFFSVKLLFLSAMSMLLLMAAPRDAVSHEVLPTIADLALTPDGVVTLDLRLNVEAFLAGVDLDVVADTDEDAGSDAYDALRALNAAELEARLAPLVATWNTHPLAQTDAALLLELTTVTIPEDVDFELPRVTELRLTAPVGAEATGITINWPAGGGGVGAAPARRGRALHRVSGRRGEQPRDCL